MVRTGAARRDALVVGGCLTAAVVQVVPPVVVTWAGYGKGAAADVALVSVSSPVLLGVVGFGVALAVALGQPGLGPRNDVSRAAPAGTLGPRLRWAAVATLVELAVLAGAVVLDGGVIAGAASFGDSLDDGSAVWTFVLLVVQAGFVELRAPVAFAVAMGVLTRAGRPVTPGRWPRGRARGWARRGPGR
jgi:hypothetical protein